MATELVRRAIGIVSTRQDAQLALIELRDAGFNMDKVSIIAKDASADQLASDEVGKTSGEQATGGAKAGAAAGAATGGFLGLIGGLGVLAIPGIGPATTVGIVLADTLLGGVIGTAGGGLLGALIGWGIPEDKAKYYDERVSQGDYLVVVEGTGADVLTAEAILNNRGIRDWGIYDSPGVTTNPRTGVI